jgi:hypothetical protein
VSRPGGPDSTGGAVRIANCSGFYGDRLSAAREMVDGGPIDVLTGDYLAELTMTILWKGRLRDPERGWATTFLTQMEQVLGTCVQRGIKVVANAGGLNPSGLAAALRQLAERLGIDVAVAHVEGDDLLPRLAELRAAGHDLANTDSGKPLAALAATPVTANAYLGAWGIVEALRAGADVVVCGRVTDAALTVGPAAWYHGWRRDDYDALAGATVAGHILECGAHATGGNYAFFTEIPGLEHPGFPLAEVRPDGGSTITKHPDTGGLVSVGTVTAQLLYEIDGPRYLTPDVTARFDTIQLDQEGPDRVRVSGTRGEQPPPTTKVGITYSPGFRNTANLVLTGLDVEAKAQLAERALLARLGGRERFAGVETRLLRTDQTDPPSNEAANATLRITVTDPDPSKVGKAFSRAVVELALASYPGFHATDLPGDGSAYAVFWPALVPNEVIEHTAVLPDGTRLQIPTVEGAAPVPLDEAEKSEEAGEKRGDEQGEVRGTADGGRMRRVPLGRAFGARSGDKAGNANLGVWARDPTGYAWLEANLTTDYLRELLPEARDLDVRRWYFPNLRALNFVIAGLLGEGVAASTRPDPQAKGLGEYLRAKVVELPDVLLEPTPSPFPAPSC